ncbi:unnamed protein product [Symbiodinium microadriaticum]|nr:unnamed protein product [Symbiodinium microadriaticum]
MAHILGHVEEQQSQGEPTGLELALNACLQELFDTRFRELQAGWSSGKLLI